MYCTERPIIQISSNMIFSAVTWFTRICSNVSQSPPITPSLIFTWASMNISKKNCTGIKRFLYDSLLLSNPYACKRWIHNITTESLQKVYRHLQNFMWISVGYAYLHSYHLNLSNSSLKFIAQSDLLPSYRSVTNSPYELPADLPRASEQIEVVTPTPCKLNIMIE